MKDFILTYLGELIAAIIAGFGGWFWERKRKKAEVKNIEVNYSQEVVQLYKEAMSDLKLQYDERYNRLKLEYDSRLKLMDDDIKTLKTSLNTRNKKYNELKREFDEYKKMHP